LILALSFIATAAFAQDPGRTAESAAATATHTVITNAGSGGSIRPTSATVQSGQIPPAFTVTADSGYVVSSIDGTCGSLRFQGSGASYSYTTQPVSADCTVVATFTPLTATLPMVKLSVDPATITAGQSATLTWSSTNIAACTASGGWSGDKAPSGSFFTDAVSSTTTYTLTCLGPNGSSLPVSATLTVNSATLAPTAKLTVEPTTITAGQSATLTWSSTDATACTASGGWSGAKDTHGSFSTNAVSSTTTYTLTCLGPNGSSLPVAATLTVNPATPAPTVKLTVEPTTITAGQSATLTWSSTDATACTASGGWSGDKDTHGSFSTNAVSSTTTYTLTCSGSGGNSSPASATLTVNPATPTSTPTVKLTVNPTTITAGQSATLTWSSTDATACTASGGWSGDKDTHGSFSTNAVSSTTTYSLTCSGPGGGSLPASAALTVSSTSANYTVSTNAGSGGAISPASASALPGKTTSFTITPDSGYTISNVTGCNGSLDGDTYTMDAITADCTVVASFAPITYAVTAIVATGGTISPTSAKVQLGETAQFTITPDSGYTTVIPIGGNCGLGSLSNTGPGYTYTTNPVTADCIVVVGFTPPATATTYTITPIVIGTGGTINPSKATAVPLYGSTSFTYTPSPGYTWKGDFSTCHLTSTSTSAGPHSVLVDSFNNSNCVVAVEFISTTAPYTVTTSAGPGGAIHPTLASLRSGQMAKFTITPPPEYSILDVSGCNGSLSAATYTVGFPTPLTADCTVTATFAPTTATFYSVTASATGFGIINPTSAKVQSGQTTQFTIMPRTGGYALVTPVGGTCGGSLSGTGPGYTYTTSPITTSCSVVATFEQAVTYTVTASAELGGTIKPEGPISVQSGETYSFTLTPNTGYLVSSVGGTCGGALSGNTFTAKAIAGNCSVTAKFTKVTTYNVTPSVGSGGAISPSTAVSVISGSNTSFTITPDTGYTLSNASGCNGSLSGTTYTTGNITGNCTVTASFTRITYTVTPSTDGNGTISSLTNGSASKSVSPATNVSVQYGSTTSFTLKPNTGHVVDSVGGTCSGTLSGTTFKTSDITSNCTIVANFTLADYTVTPSTDSNGTITPSTAVPVKHGSTTTFTLTPNTGYIVSSASGCNGSLSGTTYTTGNITDHCTVTANFAKIVPYAVTPNAGSGGTISPSTVIPVMLGENTSFTITPNTGYTIFSVNGCNGSLIGATYTTGSITGNCTVTASFTKATYTVTPSTDGNGTISPSTKVSTQHGSITSFMLKPNTGYVVDSVGGTCDGTLNDTTFKINTIAGDCTIVANFALATYTVTPSAGSNGTITPSTAVPVKHGSSTMFTLTPAAGYVVSSISGTCGGTLSDTTFTTKAIAANCTVTANFTKGGHP
jgi:hypothetical protein